MYPRTKNKAESMKAQPAPLSTMKDYDPQRLVRGYVYDMEQYLDKNIEKYCEVAKVSKAELKKVDTPFIDEAKDPQGCADPALQPIIKKKKHAVISEDAEVDLSAASAAEQGDFASVPPGKMNTAACGVIMQTMYAARIARRDLLRCAGRLATMLTKWTLLEDDKLLRMVSYVKTTKHYRECGFIGDSPDKLPVSSLCY